MFLKCTTPSMNDAAISGATTLEMVRAHDPCRTPTREKGAEERAERGESRRKPFRKDTWQSFFPLSPLDFFCGDNNTIAAAVPTDLNYAHLVESGMETVRDRVCCCSPISRPKSSSRRRKRSCSEKHLVMRRGRPRGETGVGCLILERCELSRE